MTPKYKLVIRRQSIDSWMPTLVSMNGKAVLNEAVTRKNKLLISWERFVQAIKEGAVIVETVDAPQKWAKNAAPKKAAKKPVKKIAKKRK